MRGVGDGDWGGLVAGVLGVARDWAGARGWEMAEGQEVEVLGERGVGMVVGVSGGWAVVVGRVLEEAGLGQLHGIRIQAQGC